MNVKSKVLSAGVLFFLGGALMAQQGARRDTVPAKEGRIEEVVVLGYSKVSTKSKSTAASTTISAEQVENRPNIQFLNSIQGAAPGISINSNSGSPGSGKINVLIRGLGTLNSSRDPLYIIDGLATSSSQFRNLDPNDIETISILRDAQATSVYGNRASNGVVVITTKTAKFNTALRVTLNSNTTFSENPSNKYNLANARQLLQIQNNYGAGFGASLTQSEIDNWDVDTDWNREFFQLGMSQQHNLGMNFGGENATVYSSLGYTDSEGIIKGTDFKRFTFRNNVQGRSSNKRLTYSAQLGLGYSKRNQLDQEENSAVNNNTIQNVLFGSVTSAPYLPKYRWANGQDLYNTIGSNTSGNGPYILYDNMIGGVRNLYTELSITGNVNVAYKLTESLTLGNRSGIDFKTQDRTFARSPFGYLAVVVAANSGAKFGGVETMSNARDLVFNSVTNLTYNRTFGDHNLTVAGYFDYLKGHYLFKSNTQNGLNPLTWQFGAGTGYVPFNVATPNLYRPTISASKVDAGTLAAFGTLDYDYAGRYGIGAVVRRDGSYRFSKDNRWETFWSVGARWNIDREAFMEGSSFRMLKLRASYGTQGNQTLANPANNFNPLYLLPTQYLDFNTSNTGYQNLPGYAIANLANNDLRWEKQSQANIGLDINYNNIVEANFDVYRKLTTRLFNDIAISALTGQYNIRGNNGELENKGVEANLRFNLVRNKDVNFSVFANGAYNKNTILAMDKENLEGDNVNAVGGPAYQWHLYRYVGVNPANGEQQFLDRNGNITETPTNNDRVLTGKSYYPKVNGGFGLNLDYKGFFLDGMFSYQAGGWQYDNMYSWLMDPSYAASGLNVSADLLNSWTPTNQGAPLPNINANNAGTEGSSDRFLYKTDFIRLKNISVGYNFPKSVISGLPIRSMKIFAQAENLYTWSNWKGFDPEPIAAYSLSVYPNPKSYSIGFNVEF